MSPFFLFIIRTAVSRQDKIFDNAIGVRVLIDTCVNF